MTSATRRALLILALAAVSPLAAPVVASAQSPVVAPAPVAAPAYAPAIARAERLARAVLEDAHLPGLSIAVGVGDRVVWAQGFGYADLESQTPVTPLSRFRIGSVSKTLTADGLIKLYEQGRVDLDVPIQRYVPDFPHKRWPITIRELAGHLAGVRHYKDHEFLSAKHYDSLHAGLAMFWNDSLLFKPDTRYHYSSYGWNLIGAAMASAAHEPFVPLMERLVIQPLGMAHTEADWNDSLVADRVRFYDRGRDGGFVNAPYIDESYKWSSGGYVSTPSDLVRFALSHVDGESVLKPADIQLLWTSQRLTSGKLTDYGIGWFIRRDAYGRRIVGHTGGSIGGTTAMLLVPGRRTAVALTVNLTGAPGVWDLAETLASLFSPPAAAADDRVLGADDGAADGASALATARPDSGLAGQWSFATDTTAAGRSDRGTLSLTVARRGLTGWVQDARGPWARIVLAVPRGDGVELIGAGPRGLVHLWLRRHGDRLSGRWAGAGGTAVLRGHRLGG